MFPNKILWYRRSECWQVLYRNSISNENHNNVSYKLHVALTTLIIVHRLEVYDEVYCETSEEGLIQNYRVDIIVVDKIRGHGLRPHNSTGD